MKMMRFIVITLLIINLSGCESMKFNVYQISSPNDQIRIKEIFINKPVYLVKRDGAEIKGTLDFGDADSLYVAHENHKITAVKRRDIAFFEQPKESLGVQSAVFFGGLIGAPLWILRGMPDR